MLKNFFILIFSYSLVVANANMSNGDLAYVQKNYKKAISFYKIEYNNHTPKARIKLIMSYLKLGDNFKRIKNYDESLKWYTHAKVLKSHIATKKISIIYEKQADQYYRIKKYKVALKLYKKSLKFGNRKVKNKIKTISKKINHHKSLKNDTRKVVDKNSPPWTKSIGRIIIPTKLQFITKKRYKTKYKKCSSTLISDSIYNDSDTLITASHCLQNYKENAGNIRFIIKSKSGKMLHRIVSIYKDSNFNIKDMKHKSDYAILKLDHKISIDEVTPIVVTSESFDKLQKKYKKHFGSLGGFSSDVGDYGGLITYDPKCKLKTYNHNYAASTCTGFKGASGGPMFLTTIDKNNNYRYNFVGVISHFKNKNYKKIFFTPHHIFYDDIAKALK